MDEILKLFSPITLAEMSSVKLMNRTDTKFVTNLDKPSTFAYPSGHAVRSWTYAFVLADVAPEYTKVLNKCADDYSMGRVIMGRHWKTDIDAGKMVAAKVYEKLKKSPAYQAQLKLAREQYKTVQKQ